MENKKLDALRTIFLLIGVLSAVILGLLTVSRCSRPHDYVEPCPQDTTHDTQLITAPYDAILLQEAMKKATRIDSIFLTLDAATLTNVTSVCLKLKPDITIEDIVKEYLENVTVYSGLPKQAITEPVKKHLPPKDTTATYRYDTVIINGNPTKVLIKE